MASTDFVVVLQVINYNILSSPPGPALLHTRRLWCVVLICYTCTGNSNYHGIMPQGLGYL